MRFKNCTSGTPNKIRHLQKFPDSFGTGLSTGYQVQHSTAGSGRDGSSHVDMMTRGALGLETRASWLPRISALEIRSIRCPFLR